MTSAATVTTIILLKLEQLKSLVKKRWQQNEEYGLL